MKPCNKNLPDDILFCGLHSNLMTQKRIQLITGALQKWILNFETLNWTFNRKQFVYNIIVAFSGLSKIHQLTENGNCQMRIELGALDGSTAWAEYRWVSYWRRPRACVWSFVYRNSFIYYICLTLPLCVSVEKQREYELSFRKQVLMFIHYRFYLQQCDVENTCTSTWVRNKRFKLK